MSGSAKRGSLGKRKLLKFWRDVLKRLGCTPGEKATVGTRVYLESLQSRVLLSAGLEGTWVDTESLACEDFSRAPVAAVTALLEEVHEAALLDLSGFGDSHSEMQPDLKDAVGMRELVFFDETLADDPQLIAEFQRSDGDRNLEWVALESDHNGIEEVTQVLLERSDLAAVHFVTHGADGQINLGNTYLDLTTLQQNTHALAAWGNALSEAGDILFYGCSIAAGGEGEELLKTIADLTGADVAASDDLTGSATLGGDWDLEQQTGAIETPVLIGVASRANWTKVLALSAYEPFAYSTGSLNGANGGTGWAGAWANNVNSCIVISPGLQDPTSAMTVSGGTAQLNLSFYGTVDQSRDLSTALGAPGTTAWLSFLVKPDGTSGDDYAGLKFGSPSASQAFAGYTEGRFGLEQAGGTGTVWVSGMTPSAGQTYLLTVRMDFAAGADTLTLYVNPTPGQASPDSIFTASKSNLDLGTFTNITLAGGRGFWDNIAALDEVRVGSTYLDVAPMGSRIAGTVFNDVDGDADIAEAGSLVFSGATVRLWLDNGDGTPAAPTPWCGPPRPTRPASTRSVDSRTAPTG